MNILAYLLYNYKILQVQFAQHCDDRQYDLPSGRIGIYHSLPFSASMSSGSGKSFSTLLGGRLALGLLYFAIPPLMWLSDMIRLAAGLFWDGEGRRLTAVTR